MLGSLNQICRRLQTFIAEGYRFGLVGLCATLTYIIASLSAILIGLDVYLANLLGYLASVAISYFGHNAFTFRSTLQHRIKLPRFIVLSITTYFLSNLILLIVANTLERRPFEAALAVACSIPLFTWVTAKFWVFRDRRSAPYPEQE